MHLILTIDAPPDQHKALIKAMNERKYPFEGKRKGYNKLHVSEIRSYNIRAKKEVMPLGIRDLNAMVPGDYQRLKQRFSKIDRNKTVNLFNKMFLFIACKSFRMVLKLLRMEVPIRAEGKPEPFVKGWQFSYAVATMKDLEKGMGEQL